MRHPSGPPEAQTLRLRVRGVVQGVGFRPFVFRLATRLGLSGWVQNDLEGVLMEVSGPPDALETLVRAISTEAPPAARVEQVEVLQQQPGRLPGGFAIIQSEAKGPLSTRISPDLTLCPDCLQELFDPSDRRYRYPFINCTNCGPRYSITLQLPYDRPHTTMRAFAMCPECAAEYHDPHNRRFHAQPIACPVCGPQVHLWNAQLQPLASQHLAVEEAARLLREGQILAIKGLGGYHLACDAARAEAVERLRARKKRRFKPLALMARDLEALRGYVELDEPAQELLQSPERPIVLLPKGPKPLPEALAPGSPDLGVMLPYTPLQHLLYAEGAPLLLVMTSANRSGEPMVYRDEELEKLKGLADYFLVGERPIARRVDDSVTALADGRPMMLRRARSFAPAPILQSERFQRPILALGAMLKNSIALCTGGQVFVSQHLGDLEELEARLAFYQTVQDLTRMYRVDLDQTLIVHDLHPDYPSTQYAAELPGPKRAVQHHQAHIASVLAEHHLWDEPVLGFAFDGAGLGLDGAIWGGEVMLGSLQSGLRRVAHLRYAPLLGGDAAAALPTQAAVGFVRELGHWEAHLPQHTVEQGLKLLASRLPIPSTSSIGRLFDTVAALLGFHSRQDFEGQAAMWLEGLARSAPPEPQARYTLPIQPADLPQWDYHHLLEAILTDLQKGLAREKIARHFHHALAEGVVSMAQHLRELHGLSAVVLSGGVWQNRLLHGLALSALRARGFAVYWNQAVPPGDGGIALGQVALAQMPEMT
ncbi:carbamoyltransferase HypF [Meiothermus cerbereus]|uniref:carbamoyltransferase HypF n=1 Tax=Meiothermus cerbereus TaxID=65552 RepID=UPI003EE99433